MSRVNAISGRLSLRQPQREALAILDRVMAITKPTKTSEPADLLNVIRSKYPQVEDFERKFPSLCFSLATGVGKTRLMGAFIAYLHLEHGHRHFFVLAPNLTIYGKLIADFTPNTPKYVFKGISEFAVHPPMLVTGDNYEDRPGATHLFERDDVVVNVFNISKINVRSKGSQTPRVRRLSEYLGQSYFDYLAGLDDLVVLMDEAHRYRAHASMQAIEELRPVLGLEVTATPQTEGAKGGRFKNIIYDYPLAQAMQDGLVKEPAVATRQDFNPKDMSPEALEQMKLQDGIRVHEATKVDLDVYARENQAAPVKPFVLLIARDVEHAAQLVATLNSDDFFEGRYKGKAIQVHYGQSAADQDAAIKELLKVEDPSNATEIVVHVNMLKEGWDVTNLYTIVPLRSADSRTLVEQSIGRGLRLPYGRRTGVPAVDRLTIIAHEKFQEIVDAARAGGYTFSQVQIGKDIPDTPQKTVVVPSRLDQALAEPEPTPPPAPGAKPTPPRKPAFNTPADRATAKAAIDMIQTEGPGICKTLGLQPSAASLKEPAVAQKIAEKVVEQVTGGQLQLPGVTTLPSVESVVMVVAEATTLYLALTIAIPRIVVLPKGLVRAGFRDFDVANVETLRFQPVDDQVVIQHLASDHRELVGSTFGQGDEARLEDYVVRGLIDFDDVSYDDSADLLYKLAGQVVEYQRTYLKDENEVRNVLLYHQKRIAKFVHTQMKDHVWEEATSYEVEVSQGFTEIRPQAFAAPVTEQVRDFRRPVENKINIRKMLFGGFSKGVYSTVKFDSDTERRFAMLLEDDPEVLKWTKPAKGVFRIHYTSEAQYEPDFVVETKTEKLLCEPKAEDAMQDKVIQAKAKAAALWCARATEFEKANGGKPWRYLLVPHDRVQNNVTLAALAKAFTVENKS